MCCLLIAVRHLKYQRVQVQSKGELQCCCRMCWSRGPASTACTFSPSSQAVLSCPLRGPPCTCCPRLGRQTSPPPLSLALASAGTPTRSCRLTVLVQLPTPKAGFLVFLPGALPETPASTLSWFPHPREGLGRPASPDGRATAPVWASPLSACWALLSPRFCARR